MLHSLKSDHCGIEIYNKCYCKGDNGRIKIRPLWDWNTQIYKLINLYLRILKSDHCGIEINNIYQDKNNDLD